MKINNVFATGILSTSLMTLFSYGSSKLEKENFKEPQLLGEILKLSVLDKRQALACPVGWMSHYSFGIAWTLVFDSFYQQTGIKKSAKNVMLAGFASGIVAIGAWKTFLKVHQNPSVTNYSRFYGHLILAHIIFTGSMSLSEKLLKNK